MITTDAVLRGHGRALIAVLTQYDLLSVYDGNQPPQIWRDIESFSKGDGTARDLQAISGEHHSGFTTASQVGVKRHDPDAAVFIALYSFTVPVVHYRGYNPSKWIALALTFVEGQLVPRDGLRESVYERLDLAFEAEMVPEVALRPRWFADPGFGLGGRRGDGAGSSQTVEVTVMQPQAMEALAPLLPAVAVPTVVARGFGPEWITIEEVAVRMGVSLHTILQWGRSGLVPPSTKFGYACRYWLPDIEKWKTERLKNLEKQYQVQHKNDSDREFSRRGLSTGMRKIHPAPVNYYLRGEVQKLTGFSESEVWSALRSGNLPKCVPTEGRNGSGCSGKWYKSDIDAWLQRGRKIKKNP